MDTPGFSTLYIPGFEKEDLQQFYPEFAEYYGVPTKKLKCEQNTQSPIHELTPTEQLEQAYENISNDLAADLLNKILEKKDPIFFEHLVVDMMLKMGYGEVPPFCWTGLVNIVNCMHVG